jgi:hypothetical protein
MGELAEPSYSPPVLDFSLETERHLLKVVYVSEKISPISASSTLRTDDSVIYRQFFKGLLRVR